ncbi:MAG: DNA adenine methylase [Oscillospiraceae bacterium]
MGSKARVAKYIVPIIQKRIDESKFTTYFEPFCGGCNVIDKIICETKIANDIRKPLIELLVHAQLFKEFPDKITKEEYSSVRRNPENYDNWYVGCVGFLASYNGRYFDGGYAKSGYEKTKSGERFRDYYREAKDNLTNQAKQTEFQNIEFSCDDYANFITKENPKGCVIYSDPPYRGTKQFSNSKDFDYEKFWQIMRELSKDNIVLISELNAPKDFECIWSQEVSRSIKSTDKGIATEKLFTYKKGKYIVDWSVCNE